MEPVMMSWAVNVAREGEKRNAYRVLVGKPYEKRLLLARRRGWGCGASINMSPQVTGWEGVDSVNVARDRDK